MRHLRLPRLALLFAVATLGPLARPAAQEYRPLRGQPPSVKPPAVLVRVLRDYERGWRAGNAKEVAALFSEDGMALPNGRPPAPGRRAIAAAYQGPGGDLRLRALAFATADSVGYIIGAYRYGDGTGDLGKFVLALTRRGTGPWMIVADIDNTNAPPAR